MLGCALAIRGIKALVASFRTARFPRRRRSGWTCRCWGSAWRLAIFTALIFGLAPALQTARRDLVEPLKDSGRGVSGGFRRGRLRNALVVVEVALSLVLLTGAGVMMRTFVALQTMDLGFNPHNILVARLPLPKGQYKTAAEKQRFFRQLLPRLKALPGVVEATETSALPPYGGIRTDIDIPGKTHADSWQAMYQLVSEGYFRTLGARLLRGRLMEEGDIAGRAQGGGGQPDAGGEVVRQGRSDRAADRGQASGNDSESGWRPDIRDRRRDQRYEEPGTAGSGAAGDPGAVHGHGAFERGILVRTAGNPLAMLNAVRREIWAVDRNVALTMTRTLEDFLSDFSLRAAALHAGWCWACSRGSDWCWWRSACTA